MIIAEFQVLLLYLRNSGFTEMGLNEENLHVLASELYNEWQGFNVITHTLRSKSYEKNVICRPEESTIHASFENVAKYITSSQGLLHPMLAVE